MLKYKHLFLLLRMATVITFLMAGGIYFTTHKPHRSADSTASTLATPSVSQVMKQLPRHFEPYSEPNTAAKAAVDKSVETKYLSTGSHHNLLLGVKEAQWLLTRPNKPTAKVSMQLLNANAQAKLIGDDELSGKSNYFYGDKSQWRSNVPHYGKVRCDNIYQGIDLVYYNNNQNLEYDFIVAPGASPANISLAFNGTDKVSIDNSGNLIIDVAGEQILQHKPIIYQDADNGRELIAGNYLIKADQSISFELGAYDHSKPLIIDPVVSFSSFLSGNSEDYGVDIALDAAKNIYVTGTSKSANFPTGNLDNNETHGFVIKLNAACTQILYATSFGGQNADDALAIAVDNDGNALVTGRTSSANFPTTSGAYRTIFAGNEDAFIVKLNSSGNLIYSTFLGGSSTDRGQDIGLDSTGNIYILGFTYSQNFPVTANALQAINAGGRDLFLTKLNPSGTDAIFSTYFGGTSDDGTGPSFDDRRCALAVDINGNCYLTGVTYSKNYPITAGAYTPFFIGENNVAKAGFVTKFNSSGSIVYSTFTGGQTTAIAVDSQGCAYVTGYGAIRSTPGAYFIEDSGKFIVKYNADGTAPVYATHIGGGGENSLGLSIAVNAQGEAYVAGWTETQSQDLQYPQTSAPIYNSNASHVAFVTKFNAQGSAIVYSKVLAGTTNKPSEILGLTVDNQGSAYVTGYTSAPDFITVNSLQTEQTNNGNNPDAFVAKIVSNAGTLQLGAASYHIVENQGSITIPVNRTDIADGLVTVDYTTEDDTAHAPDDYTNVSGTLSFRTNDTTANITIPITDNSTQGCGKRLKLKLSNVTGGATLGAQNTAIINIDEDDAQ